MRRARARGHRAGRGHAGEQHALLAGLVGNWKLEVKMSLAPGLPMMTTHASSEIEAVPGGRYLIEKVEGEADSAIIWRGERDDPVLGKVAARGVQKLTADDLTYESFDTVDSQETRTVEIAYTRAGSAPDR